MEDRGWISKVEDSSSILFTVSKREVVEGNRWAGESIEEQTIYFKVLEAENELQNYLQKNYYRSITKRTFMITNKQQIHKEVILCPIALKEKKKKDGKTM